MNKRLKIFTFPDKHPEYLQLQIDSYKKHVETQDTELIVINVSRDHKKTIEDICSINNIKCMEYEGVIPNFQSIHSFGYYVIEQYHWFRDVIQSQTNDHIMIIHSDIFFINNFDYKSLLKEKEIYFVPQYRHDFHNFYMWDGIVLLDSEYFNKNNLTKLFNWEGLPGCDVGAKTQELISKMNLNEYGFIEAWNIYDLSNNIYDTHLNGNIRYNFKIGEKTLNIPITLNTKSFPYEMEKENYSLYFISNFMKLKEIFIDPYNFPNPVHIDLIQFQNKPIEKAFAIHFKAGSGYQDFYNQDYAAKKLVEIKKIIFK